MTLPRIIYYSYGDEQRRASPDKSRFFFSELTSLVRGFLLSLWGSVFDTRVEGPCFFLSIRAFDGERALDNTFGHRKNVVYIEMTIPPILITDRQKHSITNFTNLHSSYTMVMIEW